MGGRLHVGSVLAAVTITTWFNGMARSLGSRRAAGVLMLFPVALLVGWLTYGTATLADQLVLSPQVARELAEPLVAILFTLPAIVSLFIAVYSVGRTAVNDMVAVLPVSRADRIGTTRWLAAALGVVIGVVWAVPLAAQFVLSLPPARAFAAAVACLSVGVLGAVTAQVLFSFLGWATSWLVPQAERLAGAVAAATTALLMAWACLAALPVGGRIEAEGPMTIVAVPVVGIAEGSIPVVLLGLLVLAVGVLATVRLVRLVDGLPQTRRRRPELPAVPLPPGRTLLGLEIRQWLRFPMNTTFVLFSSVLVGAVVTVGRSWDAAAWSGVAYGFFALVSTIGVGSFGPTRPSHWAFSVAGRPSGWVLPKLTSVLVLWAVAVAALAAVLTVFTAWNPAEFWDMLPTLLLELAAGCVVGLLLPVGREQSLGGAMSEAIAIVIVVSIALGFQSLPWSATTTGHLLTHAAGFGVLVGCYVLLARSGVGTQDAAA